MYYSVAFWSAHTHAHMPQLASMIVLHNAQRAVKGTVHPKILKKNSQSFTSYRCYVPLTQMENMTSFLVTKRVETLLGICARDLIKHDDKTINWSCQRPALSSLVCKISHVFKRDSWRRCQSELDNSTEIVTVCLSGHSGLYLPSSLMPNQHT